MTNEAILPIEHLTRPKAIARIRERLAALTDGEHCACAAARQYGVFCRGFQGMSDGEFRRRFDWIARRRPTASREELEEVVSLYHLARQEVTGTTLCCDLETREHCACDGWNMFDNETLEKFHLDLTGSPVSIG
ncbi:MAG TPA: hypothetical protein VIA29_08165 [Thermoanaerobaculia bacterium]|jgi:hypothetical protein